MEEVGNSGISKRHLSKAANSHKFRKIQKPSKCRECDSYVYWQGYECADCGLASHKKCLETLHLLCGPKRLLRKMTTFGVDLGHHLLEVGAEIPPLVQRCVAVVDSRGTTVKGIYRVSGVKSKVEIDPAMPKDAGYYECQTDNKWSIDRRGFIAKYELN